MLLNVAAGAYMEGIRMANQFIMHLDVLFSALDIVGPHLHCDTEANLVCKQMIRFFQLLTVPSKSDIGITQELLSLVTGLAQNLKSLIRIGLSAALHLVRIFLFFFFFIFISMLACYFLFFFYLFIFFF